MDMLKTGRFLKELRREQGLTQEQLGEQLGVTNKTVSRWETGSYLPPVECLILLSELYGVSINEIVSGRRLSREDFPVAAEANLSDALGQNDAEFRKAEKRLMITMLISTVLTVVILFLLPADHGHALRNVVLIILVFCLGSLGSTIHLIALGLNRERFRTDR